MGCGLSEKPMGFMAGSLGMTFTRANPPGPVEKMAFGGGIGASQVWFDCLCFTCAQFLLRSKASKLNKS